MKKLINLIYGIFIREKDTVSSSILDIDSEVKNIVISTSKEEDIFDKIKDILVIGKFNKFDIYDFKKTIDKLSSSIPQEKVLYSSVFTTISDLGTTKDDLIQSIRYYIGIISDFCDKSKRYADDIIKSSENDMNSKIASLSKQRDDNKELIEKLLRNNSEIDVSISKITADTQKYISDMKLVKENVIRVSNQYTTALKSEKDKCDKHLS